MTKQLQQSDSTIHGLKAEVSKLRAHLESLKCENSELKTRLSQCKPTDFSINHNNLNNGDTGDSLEFNSLQIISEKKDLPNGTQSDDVDVRQKNKSTQRPSSMYETREGIKIPNWHIIKNQLKQNNSEQNRTNALTQSLYSSSSQDKQTVIECTELITRSIQQLCISIQKPDDCVSSGEKVKFAVLRLATILPKDNDSKLVKVMCDILPHLLVECLSLQNAHKNGDAGSKERHLNKIREHAFHLAKYTKCIVTKYSST